jgi:glycosyltransferase involved in cell wall biosynthesis
MDRKTDFSKSQPYTLLFLFPEIYKPLKVNCSGEFARLSASCTGYIFTLCSEAYRDLPISEFRLYSGRITSSSIGKLIRRLWIQTVFALWVLLRGPRIHAIVTWDPYTSGLSGVLLKFVLRTKLIVQIVGDYHRMDPTEDTVGDPRAQNRILKHIKKALMRSILRITVSLADAVKVINKDLERFVRSTYPNKLVYRFPCYVADGYFQSLPTIQGEYLLSIGHPFYRKGVDVLIRAFRLIEGRHPRMRLRIMGYAPPEEAHKYHAMAGKSPRIEFIKPGWIEDVAEQVQGCYALVHAARSEAMGRVLFEAMACGKPIVSTKTNGGMDYVRDGATGFLCEIDDVEALAGAMDRLLSNPDLARLFGRAGRRLLQHEYSEDAYVSSFLSMVKQVITASSHGPEVTATRD